VTGPAGAFLVRPAGEADLDAITAFEIDIARVSFGDEAIEDPALHRKRVAGALGKPGEITLVAVAEAAPGQPLGWAWLSGRTNSLTGARYGNFRSLATADVPDRSQLAELLLDAVLRAADEAGFTQLTGKVHARNVGMRAVYRKFGFEATHITMEKRAPMAGGGPGPATGAAAAGAPPAGAPPAGAPPAAAAPARPETAR
jgi:L-amino acid N-acyltransferase YncA